MRRRQFLSTLGGGYSLVVLADQLPAAQTTPATATDRIRARMDAVSPAHVHAVDLETDLLVAGGGVAGVCAALAAARSGAKVVLLQDRSRLGGNSSSEVKMHIVGADCHGSRKGWRESGLIEELRLDDATNNPQRCWELWDLLLYDKVVSEPNITLLLETTLYQAEMDGGRIHSVMARCDRSEHVYRIRAKYFVDATGDSRLGLEAGAEMTGGREARSQFGESLAPEKADRETLGSSILFTSRLHHKPMPFRAPKWARKVTREDLQYRNIGPENWEYGYWWIEWGGDRDIIADNERIRFELLAITLGVWDYIKNSGNHTASANWALEWVGMMPGKRGSRRLLGDHILTQNDLMSSNFADAVAIGGWPMDDHPPAGFDRPDLKPNTAIRTPEVYNIPLRSLYSRNIPNLFLAGRNISATHVAFTSARVMATCAVIGQAVGTAAATCLEHNLTPRALAGDTRRMGALQQRLLRDDQTIAGVRNQDPADLARSARVTVSAGDASRILDGESRSVPGKPGHHWAAPIANGPAWLELTWDHPQRIREVQLTFDTGFERQLTLSASDSVTRTTIRGAQPETVRDYTLRAGDKVIAEVKGNYQRVNRHHLAAPVETRGLRIEIAATNGLDEARVFEVRAYGG